MSSLEKQIKIWFDCVSSRESFPNCFHLLHMYVYVMAPFDPNYVQALLRIIVIYDNPLGLHF